MTAMGAERGGIEAPSGAQAYYAVDLVRDDVTPLMLAHVTNYALDRLVVYLENANAAADWETFSTTMEVREQPARAPLRSNRVTLTARVELL